MGLEKKVSVIVLRNALYLIFFLAVSVGLLVGYLNISIVETVYRCDGKTRYSDAFMQTYGSIYKNNPDRPITGYLKIEEGSRLTLLYANDRYSIWWEVPDGHQSFWGNIQDLGQTLQILDYSENLEGQSSLITNSLSLDDGVQIFSGTCKVQ